MVVCCMDSFTTLHSKIIALPILETDIAPIATDIAIEANIYKNSELTVRFLQVRHTTGRYKLTNIKYKVLLLFSLSLITNCKNG